MDEEEAEPSEQPLTQQELYLPTQQEVSDFLLTTLRHSNHFHYFAQRLNIGDFDPQIPHDLVGIGNKYEWQVIKGLALMYRKNADDNLLEVIHRSRERHRKQYHHVKGNGDHPNPDATEEDMMVWGLDTICALLENRPYERSVRGYDDVLKRFEKFPEHKRKYGEIIVPQMRILKKPDLDSINSLLDFPKIGVPENVYEKMIRRSREVVSRLEKRGYDFGRYPTPMCCAE